MDVACSAATAQNKTRIVCTADDQMVARLDALARRRCASRSAAVREAVRAGLDKLDGQPDLTDFGEVLDAVATIWAIGGDRDARRAQAARRLIGEAAVPLLESDLRGGR